MKNNIHPHYLKKEDFDFTKKQSTVNHNLSSYLYLYMKDCFEEGFIITGLSVLFIVVCMMNFLL